MVLGKLSVPGRTAGLESGGARVYCACGGCGWGSLDNFAHVCHFSSFSRSARRPNVD